MYEYFPGNYRWSFAVHNALRCGAQIGEIDRALRGLLSQGDASDEDWAAAWTGAAEAQERLARRDLERGFRISAGERLLKASVFHIAAERQLDRGERKAAAYRKSLDTYRQGAELAELGIERVEVDSPDGILPGLFIPAHGPGPHPVMIFFDGFDITKEIQYFKGIPDLVARGIACLIVDGPGNGESVRFRNLPLIAETEKYATAAYEYLAARREFDEKRIGVMAISLGGYYAPRAASLEPRFACCIAWGAQWDYHAVWKKRLEDLATGKVLSLSVPPEHLEWVLGVDSQEAALKKLEDFKLDGIVQKMACPFLLVHGEGDEQIPMPIAQKCFDAVGSRQKTLKVFSREEGGFHHCQVDNITIGVHYMWDWIEDVLKPGGN
jgi:dienelactone hydrolase